MNNFRETKDKDDCTKCKFLCSWHSFTGDDDPLEPKDEGQCENEKNDVDGDQLACGINEVCDLFLSK